MSKKTETTLYLSAFAVILFITCMIISYQTGRTDEAVSREHKSHSLLAACREDNAILQRRYDALAEDSDWLTVTSAEVSYQRGAAQ